MLLKITALDLANWIIKYFPNREKYHLSPLKLQKIAFYCFSISLAKGFEEYFDYSINFSPWKHGPVCKEIYEQYKSFRANVINIELEDIKINDDLNILFHKVIYIYGSLSPWKIVEQTHLEKPWIDAYQNNKDIIPRNELKAYFENKFFNGNRIKGPEYVFDMSSFYLDNIPVVGFSQYL